MGAKILIIEDDLDFASVVKLTLESKDYSVTAIDNPEEGIRKAKEERPDLIILDVMFGEKEKIQGFDCAVAFRRDKNLAPVPILMVTAVNIRHPRFNFSPKTDGEYLPVDDFIDKPAETEDLIRKVEKLIEQKTSKWVDWPNPKT